MSCRLTETTLDGQSCRSGGQGKASAMGAPKWTAKRLAEYSDKLKDSADLDELRLRLGHLAARLLAKGVIVP